MTTKTDQYQIGLSVTAANNFTLVTDGAGGMKIARGNPGATTADILSIAPDNKITLLQPLAVASGGTGDNGSAWTQVAPTWGATTGSIADGSGLMWWKRIGKTVFINLSLTVTNNGTGSGSITFTAPFASLNGAVLCGRSDVTGGKMLQGVMKPGFATCNVFTYDNLYPASSGEVLRISGVYETSAA